MRPSSSLRTSLRAAFASALTLFLAAPASAQNAPGPATPLPSVTPLFASVNGTVISAAEYDQNARETFRNKFYHGKPPEAELNAMLRDVGQALIDRQLLIAAARERNITADPAAVATELARVDQRLQANPGWAEARERELPVAKALIETRHRILALEKQVREAAPTAPQVRAYYDKNPALFTEPARTRASLILIRVDPSSGPDAWEAAREKALGLRTRVLGGADFAALAREFSGDGTAASGGDMGYLHAGMMGDAAEAALKDLKVGDLSEPVRVLEGEAIFRLDGREPSKLQTFDAVNERAKKLLAEEMSETQWKAFLEKLRAPARIIIDPAFQKIMATPQATPAK